MALNRIISFEVALNLKFEPSVLHNVNYPAWDKNNIQVSVLREDLVHPFINGNKWRKLKYNLIDFEASGKKTLLTFGGAYSNHLVACAAAAKEKQINSIGIIRGEEVVNDYLNFMRSCGMKLYFVSRSDYRNKKNEEYILELLTELIAKKIIDDINDVFIIPEGGANAAAVKGVAEIMDEVPHDTEYIICACGTGATVAGLSKNLLPHQKVIGISLLKAEGYLEKEIENLRGDLKKITIINDYHFGGYAKKNKMLVDFMDGFYLKTKIPSEPVYTGKFFFAVDDLIRKNYFKKGSKVTVIHTGGIFNFDSLFR